MTTAKKATTAAAGDEQPTDEEPVLEPAAGAVLRLDDPAEGGEPVFAVYCGEGYIVRLGAAAKYDLPTYPIG